MERIGNVITGDYVESGEHSATAENFASGTDTVNSYDFHKTEYADTTWITIGNSVTGDYFTVGDSATGSTAYEENTYVAGSAEFTEIISEDFDFSVTGNVFTGEYERAETDGLRSSSLDAETIDASGTYTVLQLVVGTFTRTETGNSITGEYAKSESAEDEYEVEQTGVGDKNYTLILTGTHTYTDEEEGNTVTGDYMRTKNGTDEYEIEVTGTKTNGSYSQTVSGEETYTLVDSGNLATGHYDRTIQGDGTYTRTSTGAGAEMPSDTGAIDYFWEQAGDPQSGVFDLIQTGTDRYDLLEDFYDISNTQPVKSPGHMNWYPAGQTFVDPDPVTLPYRDPSIAPDGGWRGMTQDPRTMRPQTIDLPRFAPQLGPDPIYREDTSSPFPSIGRISEAEVRWIRERLNQMESTQEQFRWLRAQPIGAARAPGWFPARAAPRPPGYDYR